MRPGLSSGGLVAPVHTPLRRDYDTATGCNKTARLTWVSRPKLDILLATPFGRTPLVK